MERELEQTNKHTEKPTRDYGHQENNQQNHPVQVLRDEPPKRDLQRWDEPKQEERPRKQEQPKSKWGNDNNAEPK